MPTAEELKYGPYLKLQRARDHINDLNGKIDTFLADRPFKLFERHQRKAGKTTYFIKQEKPVPPEFSLIIGDAVHNMRSALDIALFGMVGDVEPKISFPFASSADRLKAAVKDGKIKAAGEKVVEAIYRLEPYPNGKGEGLHVIHALNIQDKHRLLILTGRRAVMTTGSGNEEVVKPFLPPNPTPGVHIVFDSPQGEDVFTVHRRYVTQDLADSEQETKVQPAFVVTFGEGEPVEPVPVINALVMSANEAHTAVDALVEAFLDPANSAAGG